MNKHIYSLIFTACLSASAIVTANPLDSGFHHDKGPGHHGGKMFEVIPDLTDEQKLALETLHEQREPTGHVRGPRGDGVSSLDSTADDYQQQVEALADSAAQRARERVLKHADMHSQIQAILTEDQLQALQDARSERRGHKRGKQCATEE